MIQKTAKIFPNKKKKNIKNTASKFSFIYKKIISRIYNGIGVNGTLNSTYEFSSKTKDNV